MELLPGFAHQAKRTQAARMLETYQAIVLHYRDPLAANDPQAARKVKEAEIGVTQQTRIIAALDAIKS